MKQNRLMIINSLAVIFIINSILVASIRSYFHFIEPAPALFKNFWFAPLLGLFIYFLFAFLIKNPHLLVKKQLSDFEDPNPEKYNTIINIWKNRYCYFRLFLIITINIISLFPTTK